jgi:hypothetical protein
LYRLYLQATMVARTRMLAGRLPYAAEAAERQQQQQQQGAGQSSEAKPPTGERMDFLAVPILQVDKVGGGLSVRGLGFSGIQCLKCS